MHNSIGAPAVIFIRLTQRGSRKFKGDPRLGRARRNEDVFDTRLEQRIARSQRTRYQPGMFAGPLGRSTFTPPSSSFESPLYGLVSLRRSQGPDRTIPAAEAAGIVRSGPGAGRDVRGVGDRNGSFVGSRRHRREQGLLLKYPVPWSLRKGERRSCFQRLDKRLRQLDRRAALPHLKKPCNGSTKEIQIYLLLDTVRTPFPLALDDFGSVLAVKGTLRRFAPRTAPGRSEGMAVYEGERGGTVSVTRLETSS